MARVEILPGWQMENGHHMAALRIALEPGWHTYWRAPGEAGIPPQLDVRGSDNLAGLTLHWPTPELHVSNGMWYLGYEDELVLPMELTPASEGPITLSGTLEFGVCSDICVPMSANVRADLSTGNAAPTQAIEAALADRPRRLQNVTCAAEPISDGLRLNASLSLPALAEHEVAVIEHPDKSIWISEANLTRTGKSLAVESDLVPADAQPFFLNRSELIITVVGGGTAYEAIGCSGG